MKVCHLAYQTWPTQCGSISRLEQILSAQRQLGINVFVISGPFQVGNLSNSIETRKSVNYYRTVNSSSKTGFSNAGGWYGRINKFLNIFSYIKQVHNICTKEKPDIIHAHATFFMGISAWVVSRMHGIPCIYEIRSTWEEDITGGSCLELQRFIIRYLEKLTIKLSDGVIFISNGLKLHYCGLYEPKCANSIIYNCVEEPTIHFANKEIPEFLRLGYVGSLVEYEGLEYLLRAGNILKNEGIPVSIEIVGSGHSEPALKKLCTDLNLNDIVTFYGRVDSDKVDDYYNQIDLIVLPRKNLLITNRVSGLKPVEAFSRKILVLASDVGGMKELFKDQIHGMFFKAENILDLVDKIKWIISNRELASQLALAGYTLFKHKFTLNAMGNQYVDFYNCLLMRRKLRNEI